MDIIESWFGSERRILTEIWPNADSEFVQENPRFWYLLFSPSVSGFWLISTISDWSWHFFLHFPCILHDLSVLKRYLDSKNIHPLFFWNVFNKDTREDTKTDTWLWMGKFKDDFHDFRRKSTNFWYGSVLREFQGDLVTFWRCRCQKVKKISIYPCIGFENIKEINKSLTENDEIMIENTFWSTEVNFWPISANRGSLRVSNTVLVHLQWSQTESGVKKPSPSSISCLKTDREHSFLSYQKGPQR